MLMRIKSKTQDSDDKIREKMIIYTFRQVFHDSAVLYQDGKMCIRDSIRILI